MHDFIKEIQAIAQIGLKYSNDPYDQQRYQRLREISFKLFECLSDSDLSQVEKFFFPEVGYATPKVDLRACVIQENMVLLVQESGDKLWSLPGGFADQNESPKEGIIREVKEETGFDIEVENLYAIKDRDHHPYKPKYPHSIYKLFFRAKITGGQIRNDHEISQVQFFPLDNLPPLSLARVLPEDIKMGYQARNCVSDLWCD